MKPEEIGRKYDKIAQWWHQLHQRSDYGLDRLERALAFAPPRGRALDVGCGAGGRMIHTLQQHGFSVTGLDVSAEMLELARRNHPDVEFLLQDISSWESDERFDLIVAWDSIFHLPLGDQPAVIGKLCQMLNPGGVLLYTFGNIAGEQREQWQGEEFYHSSIGIDDNLKALMAAGTSVVYLRLDPERRRQVIAIAQKMAP